METKNLELMERAPVPKAILTLSVPTLLSTIVSLLYNLTDTYFIGLLDDPIQLGAISLAFPVFMVIQAIGNVFGNGAPSYVSRCLGAGDQREARRTAAVSTYISVAATLFMTVMCFAFLEPILNVLGTSSDTLEPTRRYVQIVLSFSVFMTLQAVLPALLRSEGKVKEAVIGRRMLSAMKFSLVSGTGVCLVLLIPFLWLAPGFLRLFSSDPEIIGVGVRFLRAYAWVVPFMAIQMTVMCTFQAVGDGVRSMLLNLGRQLLFYIPFLYLFDYLWGLTGLLYAQTGADICVTALAVLIGLPLLRRLSKMQDKGETPGSYSSDRIPIKNTQ